MCVATLFAASGTLPLTLDPTSGLQLSSTSLAVGGPPPPPQADGYFNCASSPAALPQPQMYVNVHSAPPSFERMEIIHKKKVSDCPVQYNSVVSNKSQCPRSLPCGILLHMNCSTTVPCCYVMGGPNQSVVNNGKIVVSDFGTKCFESDNSNASAQHKVASYSSAATVCSLNCNGMTNKTWPKLENGLFLLLNFVASIRLSSSTSLSPCGSSNTLSHTPSGTRYQSNQPSTSGTFKSSSTPSTHNNMDSKTTGLSTVEHPSCHNCQQNVMRNATTHWWDGSRDSSLGRMLALGSTTAVKLTRTPGYHNPSLDLSVSGRGKMNTTSHCSHGDAITMETTTIAKCMCTSRYSEQEKIVSSPKLNNVQLAVDLHWQSGGTGDTDHSYTHRFNSTPLHFVAPGDLTKGKFTITENLLIYANSLLMMAFWRYTQVT